LNAANNGRQLQLFNLESPGECHSSWGKIFDEKYAKTMTAVEGLKKKWEGQQGLTFHEVKAIKDEATQLVREMRHWLLVGERITGEYLLKRKGGAQ